MRKLVLVTLAVLALAAVPVGAAAAASPTFRLTIAHVVKGCHVWVAGSTARGPATKVTLARGTRLTIRPDCPMDFDVAQLAGPRLRLGALRTYAGQTRVITFAKPGVYKLQATNVQTPEERGLQVLGPVNTLTLTVVVR